MRLVALMFFTEWVPLVLLIAAEYLLAQYHEVIALQFLQWTLCIMHWF